jgi:hypothetical protein
MTLTKKKQQLIESLKPSKNANHDDDNEDFIEPSEFLKNEILNEQENNEDFDATRTNDEDERQEQLIEKLRLLDGKKS